MTAFVKKERYKFRRALGYRLLETPATYKSGVNSNSSEQKVADYIHDIDNAGGVDDVDTDADADVGVV